MIVKVTIDEATSLRLISQKPNTQSMASFCAMLIEYGLKTWEQKMGSENSINSEQIIPFKFVNSGGLMGE